MSDKSNKKIDKELIIQKIDEMNKYVEHLESMKKLSKKDFLEDKVNVFATERLLQITIECLLDIGNHIISKLGLGKPQVYRDIALKLYEKDIISKDLKDIFIEMIAFRNRLVHHYYKIDSEILYQIITNQTQNFHTFIQFFNKKLTSTEE
jgi:uncharacterized protein YutE (UPF0331/DUF86 family)